MSRSGSSSDRSRALRLVATVPFLGLAAIGLYLHPDISDRLALGRRGALNMAFQPAFVACLLSLLLSATRGARLIRSAAYLARALPVLSLLLLLNTCAGCLLVLKLFTSWGVVACLLAATVLLTRHALMSKESGGAALARMARLSPISFLAVYLALGAGELFLRWKPSLSGTGGGGNPALAQIYDGLYSYNSDGLRDLELERPAPPGEFRILAIGDSFTFGQGVSFEDCYPQQLQRELGRAAGSRPIRVINAGQAGANTDWELRYLESRGGLYQPDLVLVQFYANDIEVKVHSRDPASGGERRGWMSPINQFFSHSYILFFLRDHFDRSVEQVRRLVYSDVPPDYLSALAERARRQGFGWRQCLSNFERFSDWSRRRQIPLVVSLWPHPGEQHEGVTEIHTRIAARLGELGLPCIDLGDVIRRMDPARQIAHEFDHHPSPEYHAAAARRIASFLRDRELIPD